MNHRTTITVLLATPILAAGIAAQTLTVGPQGSGAQFDNLHAAVASAAPGSTILVAAGDYEESGTLVIDKDLTLLGAGAATTTFTANPGVLPADPAVRIEGLSQGQSVQLVGMTLVSGPNNFQLGAIEMRNCEGSIELAELDCTRPYDRFAISTQVVLVRNCSLVSMTRCSIEPQGHGPGLPITALRIEDSLVHLDDCILTGARELGLFTLPPMFGGAAGVVLDGGIARISNSQLRGGDGLASPPFTTNGATPGGPAVQVLAGSVLVRGGAGCLLQGGNGASAGAIVSAGGAAITLADSTLGVVTPDVVLQAGDDGDGIVRTANVEGPGAFLTLAQRLPTITSAASQVPNGSSANLALHGEPAAICLPLFDLALGTPFTLPGVIGQFTLAFSPAITLTAVTLDAGGSGALSVPIPSSPQLIGVSGCTQSMSFAPSGWVGISSPTSFAVR